MAVAIALQLPKIVSTRPFVSASIIIAGDQLSLIAALMTTASLRQVFNGDYKLSLYWNLWPLLGLFALVYAMFGLYPGLVTSTVAELRKITSATTLGFLVIGALSFVLRDANEYSRMVFLIAWIVSLFLLPAARSIIRRYFSQAAWWGYPVVVFGTGTMVGKIVRKLLDKPESGLRPAVVFDHAGLGGATSIQGIPVLYGIERTARVASEMRISRAIIVAPSAHISQILQLIESHANVFSHVIIIPDLIGLSSVGIETRDVCRMLGLELRRSLLLPGPRFTKRLIDLTFAILFGLGALPLLLIIAILIKLDSPGPVFYAHRRLGHRSSPFYVWKYRTMSIDGKSLLAQYFLDHPECLIEWRRTHKLKNDPRLTRIGRLLRKTSLDELPQLWNVIRGEMSLVGPRPIVDDEVEKYGDSFNLYRQVPPGLTGLWQVSGRNNTTYEERVELDTYYVRNWSPWVDIYLLVRTIKVVLKGQGAY